MSASTTDAAVIVVSAFVTNVVDHAHTLCDVTATRHPAGVWIDVSDSDPIGIPAIRRASRTALRAGGLRLVAGLATAWGVTKHPAGKTVWALLPESCT